MMNKYFGLSALALAFAIVTPACGAAGDEGSQGSSADEVRASKDFTSCKIDHDCVAVPRAGCCSNGFLDAVATNKVNAYEAAHVCNEQVLCPQFQVKDMRVAQCNTETLKCEMILPADIACGGFTRNPHQCPKGHECMDLRGGGDIPGACKPIAAKPAETCGTATCAEGEHCCNPLSGICVKPGFACAL